jgi:hypothetical protein
MARVSAEKRAELEGFWRSHHEGWKTSPLNQREYCDLHGLPLKRFGNWRVHCHINLVKAQDWFWFYDQAFRAAAFQPLNAPARNFLNKGRLIRWKTMAVE